MNTFDLEIRRRHSLRLKDYDYSQPGAYFVTIATYQREALFGQIIDDVMNLNGLGRLVKACWEQIPHHFKTADTDAFIIMPNHVHGIIVLSERAQHAAPLHGEPGASKPTIHLLPTVIRSFKSAVSKEAKRLCRLPDSVWQRSYYEHVIRDDDELNEIRQYITSNPVKWALDRDNPEYNVRSVVAQHAAP